MALLTYKPEETLGGTALRKAKIKKKPAWAHFRKNIVRESSFRSRIGFWIQLFVLRTIEESKDSQRFSWLLVKAKVASFDERVLKVGTQHVLTALIASDEFSSIFISQGVSKEQLSAALKATREEFPDHPEIVRGGEEGGDEGEDGEDLPFRNSIRNNRDSKKSIDVLTEFGVDLTEQAREGGIDPIIGRAFEVQRVMQILGRRRKNNPILIGEPGVGKTAVAEGLALLIVSDAVPATLKEKKIVTIELGSLVAGTRYRGEFEDRLRRIVEVVRNGRGIYIMVIDEIHTLVGAGSAEGSVDGANILKPDLARGVLRCIGATTIVEYRKYISKDPALQRRFQPVNVGQPSVAEAVKILSGLRTRYERYHKVKIVNESLLAAASLSDRYIADRFLPDKAIDLIDEAASRARLLRAQLPLAARDFKSKIEELEKEKLKAVRDLDFEKAIELRGIVFKEKRTFNALVADHRIDQTTPQVDPIYVCESHITEVVSSWTRIPVSKVTSSEAERLLRLEVRLHEQVIGQDQAVIAVSKSIRRARAGLKSPERPIANFIFAGPTGTGKTELAKVIASYFFGSLDSLIRLDMSEYMERHTVSKIIGSPPGYVGHSEGGRLTEQVRNLPYCVVLLDEIEKAHPDVYNIMLQIFDDGHLTDSKGRLVDFKNVLMILTTNVGAVAVTVLMSRDMDLTKELKELLITNSPKESEKTNSENSRVDSLQMDQGIDLQNWVTPFEDASLYAAVEYDPNWSNDQKYATLYMTVKNALRKVFRPEFLNRLDEIIIFRLLSLDEVGKIATLMLSKLAEAMLSRKGLYFEFTRTLLKQLVFFGYDKDYGARPLRRVITNYIEDPIADKVLKGDVTSGDYFLVDGLLGDVEKLEKTLKSKGPQVDFTKADGSVMIDGLILARKNAAKVRLGIELEDKTLEDTIEKFYCVTLKPNSKKEENSTVANNNPETNIAPTR
jgi:ATP-dependent Clp protease ATP-binding subunit ClpC